jgi:hypothetical protein
MSENESPPLKFYLHIKISAASHRRATIKENVPVIARSPASDLSIYFKRHAESDWPAAGGAKIRECDLGCQISQSALC